MKKLLLCVLLALAPTAVLAQQSVSAEETIVVKKSQVDPAMFEQLKTQQKVETYGKWVGLGKEVGEAANGTLTALSDTAVKFSGTGLGKFSMFLIAWKILGYPVIQAAIGVPLLLFGTLLFVWSFLRNCIRRTVLTGVSADKVKTYHTMGPDSDQQIGHIVFYVIYVLICCAIIFIH